MWSNEYSNGLNDKKNYIEKNMHKILMKQQ